LTNADNGQVQLQLNGTSTSYNINPTPILVSNNSSSTPQPTFTRSSTAYKQDGTQMSSGEPRYETGEFGQGIMVEEGTTPLIQNGFFANYTGTKDDGLEDTFANWTNYATGTGRTEAVSDLSFGNAALKTTMSAATVAGQGRGVYQNRTLAEMGLVAGDEISLQSKYKMSEQSTGAVVFLIAAFLNSSGADIGYTYVVNQATAAESTYTIIKAENQTVPIDTVTIQFRVLIYATSPFSGQNNWLQVDYFTCEKKAYSTSPTDVIRAAETLTIPTQGILSIEQGTWEQMAYITDYTKDPSIDYAMIFCIPGTSGYIGLYHEKGTSNWRFITFDGTNYTNSDFSDSYTPNGWHRFGATWTQTDAKLFVDGVLRATINSPIYPATLDTAAWVGYNTRNNCAYLNTLHDDICISSIARTDSEMQARGTSTSPLPVDQYTTAKYNLDGNLSGQIYSNSPVLPDGKISGISIDSSYVSSSGQTISLPSQLTNLQGVSSTNLAISGDGKRIYYLNPSDNNYLYMFDYNDYSTKKATNFSPISFKPSYNGDYVAFKAGDSLYLYNNLTEQTPLITYNAIDFSIAGNGTVYYEDGVDVGAEKLKKYFGFSSTLVTSYYGALSVSRDESTVFVSNNISGTYYLHIYKNTPNGFKGTLSTTSSSSFSNLHSNKDGSLVFFNNNGAFYSYQVSTKSMRKLDISGTIIKITDEDKVIYRDPSYYYKLYDPDTDTSEDIRPSDAVNPATSSDINFSVDDSGNKMAYVSTSGISTSFINGAERPERYLFSFDGKNSWLSYKDGVWSAVKTGSTPVEEDFNQYGMTIEKVNSLTASDFDSLYENGKEVYNFDVAVYFASIDSTISPSLKGIKITMNGSSTESGEVMIEKSLFTTKHQDFTSSNWRKIRKIYPIEIQPKEAEMYYLIVKDGVYSSHKDGQWINNIDPGLLTNVEGNWIDSSNGQGITQIGMTADELRAIPETELTSLLPATTISVIFAMKVDDVSTADYSSLISVDYTENLFTAATLTLKIKYIDGTSQDYTDLTKSQVENFMEWITERQFGRGPIFYTIKTIVSGVEVNDFINYFTIKTVSVDDTP